MKRIFTHLNMLRAACCLAGALASHDILAQPYYTNTSQGYGAQQYNNNYAQPLQPSKTLAQQYQAGILTGTIPPAPWSLLTNSFSTNLYTMAPVITANAVGTFTQGPLTTNCICVVTSTTAYFILQTSETNITVNWSAIGH